MICGWNRYRLPTSFTVNREKKFATIPCDPRTPKRLAVCEMHGWYDKQDDGWGRQGTPMSEQEIQAVLDEARAFLKKPVMVVFSDHPQREQWLARCEKARVEEMTELEWACVTAFALKDKRPFGEALMRRVAAKLRGGGAIYYTHRDYCGHGLRFDSGGYELTGVYDGGFSNLIARWPSEDEFVASFAALSDFSCSGADPNAGLFVDETAWELGNQRITRARLEAFVAVSNKVRSSK